MIAPVLVTIVTPAYNQADFLAATIESVLAQDYPHIEYIVIDDGSSDDSLAVAQRYADRGVTVLTQANAGQAATLNRGWGLANGEVLAYLSSDDCLRPNAVSKMVAALSSKPHAAVAYCDFSLIDALGRRMRGVQTEDFSAERLCVDLVCQPGPGAFFRREVFDRTGGWDASLRQVPDFEFWLRAVQVGDFVRVPECLAEYRIHEGSASFRVMAEPRAEEIVNVVRRHLAAKSLLDRDRARLAEARAMAMAAKNHAQSGRPGRAILFFTKAVALKPGLVLELGVWRQLLVGMLRRGYYSLKLRSAKG